MKVLLRVLFSFIIGAFVLACCSCGKTANDEKDKSEIDSMTIQTDITETTSTTELQTTSATTTTSVTTTILDICFFDNTPTETHSYNGITFDLPSNFYLLKSENGSDAYTITDGEEEGRNLGVLFVKNTQMENGLNLDKAKEVFGEIIPQTVLSGYSNHKLIITKDIMINNQNNNLYKYEMDLKNADGTTSNCVCYMTYYYNSYDKKLYFLIISTLDSAPFSFELDLTKIAQSIKPALAIDIQLNSQPSDRISINSVNVKKNNRGELFLIVHYKWTNMTDSNAYFLTDMTAKCFQNGVACDTGYIYTDDCDLSSSMTEVMPGYSHNVDVAYKINDLSDITLQVSEFMWGDEYLNATIKLS